MKITHIVGLQGSGKSTLAKLMVEDLEKRGAFCAVVDSESMFFSYKGDPDLAIRAHAGVGHLFLEWMPHHFDLITLASGDRVIRIADVPALDTPQPTPAAQEGQGA